MTPEIITKAHAFISWVKVIDYRAEDSSDL